MELEETADNKNEGVNKNWENIVTACSCQLLRFAKRLV